MPKGCNGPQSFHAFYLVVYEWMNDCKKNIPLVFLLHTVKQKMLKTNLTVYLLT